MNALPRGPMSLEAFLAWEECQEQRYEFDGSRPVGLAGESTAHATILTNLAISVGGRLRGGPWSFFGGTVKIQTGRTIRYPDGLVTCAAGPSSAIAEPVILFEIVSPSTSSTDHIAKHSEYAVIPSVRRYILLEDQLVGATVFARSSEGWIGRLLTDGAVLAMPEIGIELPLAEFYEGLNLASNTC